MYNWICIHPIAPTSKKHPVVSDIRLDDIIRESCPNLSGRVSARAEDSQGILIISVYEDEFSRISLVELKADITLDQWYQGRLETCGERGVHFPLFIAPKVNDLPGNHLII